MAIANLTAKLRTNFLRRHSTTSNASGSHHPVFAQAESARTRPESSKTSHTLHSQRSRPTVRSTTIEENEKVEEGQSEACQHSSGLPRVEGGEFNNLSRPGTTSTIQPQPLTTNLSVDISNLKHDSISTVDFPTPNTTDTLPGSQEAQDETGADATRANLSSLQFTNATTLATPASPDKPSHDRQQSLIPSQQTTLIKSLLETDLPGQTRAANLEFLTNQGSASISANMVSRKIWVKRPGASATLVSINEDDLVDDVRDMILRKYANSLGRSFDSPDVTLRIVPREQQRQERTLGPEEPMCRTLDAYFPGGQTVDEALVIDVPLRRTPKPSPQPQNRYYDEQRPVETGTDYFPPMPLVTASPHLPTPVPGTTGQAAHHPTLTTHAMSVLTTGHVPALPSPGSTGRRGHHRERPRIGRQHTSSPTVLNCSMPQTTVNNGTQASYRRSRSRTHSSASEHSNNAPPVAPPLPTPPAPAPQSHELGSQIQRVATPPPRISSPRPSGNRLKKSKKASADHPTLPSGMLNGAVPPINVLIVEDNFINLKLLEAFMKRLKVRWQTATDGREAVNKWRSGGFHLVLMDIQLPIMSGLEATKEIRRLERLNSIGVFSSSASATAPEQGDEPSEKDKLPSNILFKSPVIIVALTASSLQSDRHEALAAGCNDFLTKPVNFVWLERKVMEWGCMQALIDFDGWRKWKDFSQSNMEAEKGGKALATAKKKKANRTSLGSNPGGSTSRLAVHEEGPESIAVS